MNVSQTSRKASNTAIFLALILMTVSQMSASHAISAPELSLTISDLRVSEMANSTQEKPQLSVTLTGSVTNNSAQAITDNIKLLSTRTMSTRTELSEILAHESRLTTTSFSKIKQEIANLAPGETRPWSLTFDSRQVFEDTTSGVAGIGIEIGSSQLLTALPWFYSDETLDPTKVTFALQLATSHAHTPRGLISDFEQDSEELDRLTVLATATANETIPWVVDPALRVWLADFSGTPLESKAASITDAINAHGVRVVPQVYGQANVPALLEANQKRSVENFASQYGDSHVYYLAPNGALSRDLVQNLKSFPQIIPITTNEVVSGSSLNTTAILGKVDTSPILISDQGIASCFSAFTNEFEINQCVLSSIAMITAESPNFSRHVLVTTPHAWNPSASAIAKLMSVLTSSNWVKLTDLPTPVVTNVVPSMTLTNNSASSTFSTKFVKSYKSLLKQANALDTLFPDTRISTQLKNAAYLAASSNVVSASAAENLLQQALEYARESSGGVTVETSNTFTIAGQVAQLPITIVNAADQPVRVGVIITPESAGRLNTEPSDVVSIQSGQRVTVSVPIRIIGAGSVSGNVNVVTTTGSVVGQGSRITINSTAYQDFARNLVYGAFIALLLLASNNYRVRRRQARKVQTIR